MSIELRCSVNILDIESTRKQFKKLLKFVNSAICIDGLK